MSEQRFAKTPNPPYYAVIFSSQKTSCDSSGYAEMADLLDQLALKQPGFLGIEYARDASGFGITVSYWDDLQSIANWKAQADHMQAQARGKSHWYSGFELRISKVERAYNFRVDPDHER